MTRAALCCRTPAPAVPGPILRVTQTKRLVRVLPALVLPFFCRARISKVAEVGQVAQVGQRYLPARITETSASEPRTTAVDRAPSQDAAVPTQLHTRSPEYGAAACDVFDYVFVQCPTGGASAVIAVVISAVITGVTALICGHGLPVAV